MLRRFSNTMTVIFVAPVAVAMSDEGGCSTSSQQAMSQDQVQETFVGNTMHSETTAAFAYIDASGSIRAEINTTDAVKTDVGTWTLDEQGNFCVEWTETVHGKDNCAQFMVLADDEYQWGGHTLTVKAGNPNNL